MLIFAQGAVADAVYVIIGGGGHVRIGATNRSSKGMMIEIFRTGDMFGEIGVIDGSAQTADAGAVARLELLRIGSQVFLEALDAHSALATNLCRILSARLRRTFDLLQDATFESLEVRLARQILYLAKRGGRRTAQGQQLAGRFRQNDLADLLGATTRSIITILNAWRASGLVVYDPARAQLTLSLSPRTNCEPRLVIRRRPLTSGSEAGSVAHHPAYSPLRSARYVATRASDFGYARTRTESAQ